VKSVCNCIAAGVEVYNIILFLLYLGRVVAYFVETLAYKLEGHGFNS
jgi:hypothetical protein